MDATSPELLAALARFDIAHEAALLAPHAHFEIALVPAEGAPTRAGMSRIGGAPDVPAGFTWPCQRWPLAEVVGWPDFVQKAVAEARAQGQVRDEDGHLVMPLTFLAQIDLADVCACDLDRRLPESGILLFFASTTTDIEDPLFAKRVASAVRYIDAKPEDLRPLPQPETLDPGPTGVVALRAERRLCCELTWEELTALNARLSAGVFERIKKPILDRGDALLAAPFEECNGPMPPAGEVALLRLDEHDEVGLYIGDASWVTFAIPEADLRVRRFEAARASVFIG
jgi:hypothetical protein